MCLHKHSTTCQLSLMLHIFSLCPFYLICYKQLACFYTIIVSLLPHNFFSFPRLWICCIKCFTFSRMLSLLFVYKAVHFFFFNYASVVPRFFWVAASIPSCPHSEHPQKLFFSLSTPFSLTIAQDFPTTVLPILGQLSCIICI